MASHNYSHFLSFIIFTTVGFPLNLTLTDYELWAADMNQDGNIDILDIVLIVNTILR